MINDKSLENHLNAIKEGKQPEKQQNLDYKWAPQLPESNKKNIWIDLLLDIYKNISKSLGVLIVSILYGYGLAAIFKQDWQVLQTIGVGILFNHSLTIFPLLIKNFFIKTGPKP